MKRALIAALTLLFLTCSGLALMTALNNEFQSHGHLAWFTNSDSLYIPLIARDLIAQGPAALQDWHLTPNPYYVPDMIIGTISTRLSSDKLLATIGVYAWIQITILSILLVLTCKTLKITKISLALNKGQTLIAISLTSLILSSILGILLTANNNDPGIIPDLLEQIALNPLNSGHHFSVVLMILLCLYLSTIYADQKLILNGKPRTITLWSSALGVAILSLFVASDIFIALWFSMPYLLSRLAGRLNRRAELTWTLKRFINDAPFITTLAGSVLGFAIFKTTNKGYTLAHKPEIGLQTVANSLENQLRFFGENSFYYYAIVPACTAFAIIYLLRKHESRLSNRPDLALFLALQIGIGFAMPALTAQFPIANDQASNGGIFRYTMIIAMAPFITLGISIAASSVRIAGSIINLNSPTRIGKLLSLSLLITGLCVSSTTLAAQVSDLNKQQTILASRLTGDLTDAERLNLRSTCVYAEYWDAKKWRALADLDTRQILSAESGTGYAWITNRQWIGAPSDACLFRIDQGSRLRSNSAPQPQP